MFLGKSALTANNFAVGYTTKEMIIHATGSDKKVGTGVFFKAIYWLTNHVVSKKIYIKNCLCSKIFLYCKVFGGGVYHKIAPDLETGT